MTTAAAPAVRLESHWSRLHGEALVALLGAAAAAGILLPRLYGWLVVLAAIVALAAAIGHGVTGLAGGILVDERGRISLSRLQVLLWTLLVLSTWLAAVLANVGAGIPAPLAVAVPKELWLALGVSTTSLVASPLVATRRRRPHAVERVTPRATDLFRGEGATVDLSKVQLFLFTAVLVLAYAAAVGQAFATGADRVRALPGLDEAAVILLTISHAGYLTRKATAS